MKKLGIDDLNLLSSEIREYIIDVISQNGGHLAPSLGVVELTIALHYIFDTPVDKVIWDVGHQTYAHKILTGRKNEFPTIRKLGGLSGFPKRKESPYDTYNVGHSSTSLSLALGEAVARDLQKQSYKVVAVIGDGSITNGMAFEALNHIGHKENDLIIILNDNEHSICKNVGALPKYFNRMITGDMYNKVRRTSRNFIKNIPSIGDVSFDFLQRFFDNFKSMIVPGQLFEDMGIRYFGPVDGHDMASMIEVFNGIKKINYGPKIIHLLTKKGKGYIHAENEPAKFHGIGPFNRKTGIAIGNNRDTFSDIAGRTLLELAEKDEKIIAITAAMKIGTGLYDFEKKFPQRFFDVGIAEQHMLTFAAAMASAGLKPFISVYSTFLQRAYDQLIHDIALMNLPVRILIDRSGIVGDDGETHHGLFDISMIRDIPNFIILAPSSGDELKSMIIYASEYNNGPIAIRYPRGAAEADGKTAGLSGGMEILAGGSDVAIFAAGDMVKISLEVHDILKMRGISSEIVKVLTIKPMDPDFVEEVLGRTAGFITMENAMISGGLGEYILSSIKPRYKSKLLFNAGFPDEIIPHGTAKELFERYKLDPVSIADRIAESLKQ